MGAGTRGCGSCSLHALQFPGSGEQSGTGPCDVSPSPASCPDHPGYAAPRIPAAQDSDPSGNAPCRGRTRAPSVAAVKSGQAAETSRPIPPDHVQSAPHAAAARPCGGQVALPTSACQPSGAAQGAFSGERRTRRVTQGGSGQIFPPWVLEDTRARIFQTSRVRIC